MATRISGGIYKSRSLKTPDGLATRPTATRVREALFSILGDVTGSRFIDLYAGSGSVGIEAASRGAKEVVLVENGQQAVQCIKENIKQLAITNVTLITLDAQKYCERLADNSVDILFCDPPFVQAYPDMHSIVRVLCEGGVAVFQYPSSVKIEWLTEADSIRKYGENSLALFYRSYE